MMENIEPPEKLYRDILTRIGREKRRIARIQFALSGITAIISVIALVPAGFYAFREFYQSEFYQYLSAIFSDGGIALAYWKEFLLSLAESAPLLESTILLSLVFVFMVTLKLAAKSAKNFASPPCLIKLI